MYLLVELIAWFKPDQILNLADYLVLFKLCKTDLIKNNLNGSMYSKNIFVFCFEFVSCRTFTVYFVFYLVQKIKVIVTKKTLY
jgi:hypothetical protein